MDRINPRRLQRPKACDVRLGAVFHSGAPMASRRLVVHPEQVYALQNGDESHGVQGATINCLHDKLRHVKRGLTRQSVEAFPFSRSWPVTQAW